METFKKIFFGAFIVLIGIGDIVFDKSWLWGSVIVAIGLSLLVKKWGNIMVQGMGQAVNAEQIVAIAKVLIGIAILLGACRPLWMKRVDEKLNGRRPLVNILKAPRHVWLRRIWTNQVGRVGLILVAGSICVVFAARILGAIGTSSTSRASSVSSKFTSEEFGFAAKFTTSNIKEKTISPAMTSFVSYIDNGASSEVQVLTKDLSQDLVDDAYLDRMMETTVKAGRLFCIG